MSIVWYCGTCGTPVRESKVGFRALFFFLVLLLSYWVCVIGGRIYERMGWEDRTGQDQI